MRSVCIAAALLAACGPDDSGGPCKDSLVAGSLVITEVFADYAAPTGGTGTDDGKEWFEIYNAGDEPVSLQGLTIVHARPDDSRASSHTMEDVTLAPGQYFTLGNSTSDLVPPYVDYGYSADLGDFFNTDGGKLTLKCGDSEIDSAQYELVKSGRSRQLSNAGPPDYAANDDLANWCESRDSEFEPNNSGTPGEENDCAPVVMGACTDGATMRPVVTPAPGELVITEVMPSPQQVSDTAGEWFEAKALAPFDLNGLGLDRAGDTSAASVINSPTCVHVDTGDYVLFAKSLDTAMNGGVDGAVATFGFAMVAGSMTAPGDVQIVAGATVIDAISWTSSTNGRALALDPDLTDATSNDNSANFCNATATYGLGDFGTPGMVNGQCTMLPPPGMCDDNGTLRAIAKPAMGNLVITEVMMNPRTETSQEWFEITNIGSTPFDLNGLGLDRAGDSALPSVVNSPACKSLLPGAFALFARNPDTMMNGGLPVVDWTFGFSMVNTNGDVQVVDPTTCTGTPIVCATVYDNVTYTTANGWPAQSSPNGATPDGVAAQVTPGMYSTTANDTYASWCLALADYGTANPTNKGTPKAANACM
ncbi:MAG TPA: lamin tail domain-containing protein [Kofleriaceae bacterium]